MDNRKRPVPNKNPNDFGNPTELQNFNNRQIYTKGFSFTSQAGTENQESPILGGKARFLHGITVFNNSANITDEDVLSLTLNEELIISKVIWWAYNPQGAVGNIFKREQYFPLPRPLSGSDSLTTLYKTANAHNYYIVFYLSDK